MCFGNFTHTNRFLGHKNTSYWKSLSWVKNTALPFAYIQETEVFGSSLFFDLTFCVHATLSLKQRQINGRLNQCVRASFKLSAGFLMRPDKCKSTPTATLKKRGVRRHVLAFH